MKNTYKRWTREENSILYSIDWYYGETPKKGALSRDTAAELYGFGEYMSQEIVMTVPTGYNSKKLKNDHIITFSNKSDKYEFQMEQYEFEGMIFNIYSPERTIVEIIKDASGNFNDVIRRVIRNFFKNVKFSIEKLMEAAKVFKVEKEINAFQAAYID